MSTWQRWAPDLGVGALVALLGTYEVLTTTVYDGDGRAPLLLLALGIAVAVTLSRQLPGVALALVWAIGAMQLLVGSQVLAVELAIGLVAFGTARWGSTATVWLSALSIPAACLVAVGSAVTGLVEPLLYGNDTGYDRLLDTAYRVSDRWQVGAVVIALAVLAIPWLAGLALRFLARAQGAQVSQVAAEADAARAIRERGQAEEIARLRDEQARLARDVHDVVGHSLAVILAQAESAQYLPDADTAKLKQTMENIASSARTSLDDVRQVLSATAGRADANSPSTDLDTLVEGVRASGHPVVSAEYGLPQPLPPELQVVAVRVLQEMLTNALKHGSRDHPVRVERHWEGELRIEVQNAMDPTSDETRPVAVVHPAPNGGGHGVDGMRRRLESVGGRLDVRRRHDPPTFTATAWLPVRASTR